MCYASLSSFLAQVIGLYLILSTLSMLLHHQQAKKVTAEFLTNHSMLAFTGSFGLIIGLLIVISHNLWVSDWPVLVTLIGWIVLLQAVLRLFFPDTFVKMVKDMMNKSGYLVWCWIWLIVGVYLTWMSFAQ